ncbi:MAG: hypothetical protein EPN85_12010 [Bacteroidetes bacterium]|nr:MAG: hypothetical protein EPN85_12010 [Bacteroidota bacterium]
MAVKYKQYVSSYNSVNRREYYQKSIFPESPSLFSDMWNSEKNKIPDDLSIVFRDLIFGSIPETVADILGKPRFVIENHGLSSLIFFYKERVNNHQVLVQVHFLGKEFFYAGYTFRDESNAERKAIKKVLFEKYSVINSALLERQDHLEDRDKNIISIRDSVNFNIIYLWGDDKIKNAVSQNAYSLRFDKEREKRRKYDDLRSKL